MHQCVKLSLVIFLLILVVRTGWSLNLRQDITAKDAPLGDTILQSLTLDNAYHDAGSWGDVDQCTNGSFASAIEVRYLAPSNLDETAVNAIKLYCTDYSTGRDTGYITSTTGDDGQWWGMMVCSEDFVTGFRANVLAYQGGFVDDVAVENFDVYCNDGKELVEGIPIHVPKYSDKYDFKEGDWSSFANCDVGNAVCGIQTRYESSALGDATAIADIILYCCGKPVT